MKAEQTTTNKETKGIKIPTGWLCNCKTFCTCTYDEHELAFIKRILTPTMQKAPIKKKKASE